MTFVERDARMFVRPGQARQSLTNELEAALLRTLEEPSKAVKLPLMSENRRSNLRAAWAKHHPTTRLTIRKTITDEFVAWVEPVGEKEATA